MLGIVWFGRCVIADEPGGDEKDGGDGGVGGCGIGGGVGGVGGVDDGNGDGCLERTEWSRAGRVPEAEPSFDSFACRLHPKVRSPCCTLRHPPGTAGCCSTRRDAPRYSLVPRVTPSLRQFPNLQSLPRRLLIPSGS